MNKNEEITLRIDSVSAEGLGVGRFVNFVIFVAETAPGDLARVQIVKIKKACAYGKLLELLEPSPNRINQDCPVFKLCGGCALRHISYEEELRIKKQNTIETFRRIGKTDVDINIIPSKEIIRYRNKAMFPFGLDKDGKVCLGVFANRSHRLVAVDDCMLMPEIFKELKSAILEFVNLNGITVYNEETGQGLLRHLYLRRGYTSREIMICFIINGTDILKEDILAETMMTRFQEIHGVLININKRETNEILGDSYRVIKGESYITDELCGLKLRMSPDSFYQVNSNTAEVLYKEALKMADIKVSDTMLDLFCGIGSIGLYFAKESGAKVTGAEITGQAVEDARFNATLNQIDSINFIQVDLNNEIELPRADIILVDPPRKGLGRSLTEKIVSCSPGKVVYISCDPGTLARDITYFAEFGYTVQKALGVDMFPRTPHVECAMILTKGELL